MHAARIAAEVAFVIEENCAAHAQLQKTLIFKNIHVSPSMCRSMSRSSPLPRQYVRLFFTCATMSTEWSLLHASLPTFHIYRTRAIDIHPRGRAPNRTLTAAAVIATATCQVHARATQTMRARRVCATCKRAFDYNCWQQRTADAETAYSRHHLLHT